MYAEAQTPEATEQLAAAVARVTYEIAGGTGSPP